MEPILGDIFLFAFGFAPQDYQTCQGQLLAINTNQALFTLLGTMYGGNGQTTFGLPNLQGRAGVGAGQLTGGSTYTQGQTAGVEKQTLSITQLPAHTHVLQVSATPGTTAAAGSTVYLASGGYTGSGPNKAQIKTLSSSLSNPVTIAPQSIASYGGTQPYSNLSPGLVLNYAIALAGIFPSRS